MFQNILGNESIKKLLIEALKNDQVSHSYLFVGNSGIGKKMIAKEFAKEYCVWMKRINIVIIVNLV